MITKSQIKAAVRASAAGKSRTELHDRGPRGAGRLVLIIRGKGTGAAPSAEFFACWYRDGRRVLSKLGSHPAISLADARKRFREEFAPDYQRRRGAIQRRRPSTPPQGGGDGEGAVRGLRGEPPGGRQTLG
jgi:hypothetical protein